MNCKPTDLCLCSPNKALLLISTSPLSDGMGGRKNGGTEHPPTLRPRAAPWGISSEGSPHGRSRALWPVSD